MRPDEFVTFWLSAAEKFGMEKTRKRMKEAFLVRRGPVRAAAGGPRLREAGSSRGTAGMMSSHACLKAEERLVLGGCVLV